MKKRILLNTLFFFILLQPVFSQHAILRGGVNIANITTTNDGNIDKANSLTSFQAGILGDVRILPMLFFQPGIVVTGKGSKTEQGSTSSSTYYRATSNPWYIEIPATFIIKTPTGATRLFAGAGPYLAIGIAGKNTADGKVLGTTFHHEQDIQWSNDDPSTLNYEEGAGYGIMKRFDYGLNGTAGFETKNAVFSVNYGLGLAKLQSGSNSSEDDKNKHRVLSFTIGFKL